MVEFYEYDEIGMYEGWLEGLCSYFLCLDYYYGIVFGCRRVILEIMLMFVWYFICLGRVFYYLQVIYYFYVLL